MSMKLTALTGVATVLAVASVAQAQLATNVSLTSVNALIPDGQITGMASQTTISGLSGSIYDVSVSLDILGGINGALYAYLTGPNGGFAVLLNRPGVTGVNSFGNTDAGLNITLTDAGSPANIHNYQADSPSFNSSGQLTGIWAPDGININPQSSPSLFDAATPTADFSSFTGSSPDGAWTLFVADVVSGGDSTLVSWGLTVVTAPEPQSWVFLAGGAGLLLALCRRRCHRG